MWRGVLTIALAALLVPSLASAQQVSRDWDKAYDFSKMKTYAVKMGTGWGNPLSEKRVMTDISEALAERGWKEAPEESADALVVVHGSTDTKHELNTFYSGWGTGWGWSASPGTATTTTYEYRVGTLVVDIFDVKTKKLTFRGTASDELSKDPKKNEKKSDKAAQKLFKEFPPGSNKKT